MFYRPLSDGSVAVALLNAGDFSGPNNISVQFTDVSEHCITTVYYSISQNITVNSIVKYDINFFTNTDWSSEYFCFCAWCARATWSRDVLQNVHSSRKPIRCAPGETHPNWYTSVGEQARLAVTWLELTCKSFIHDLQIIYAWLYTT